MEDSKIFTDTKINALLFKEYLKEINDNRVNIVELDLDPNKKLQKVYDIIDDDNKQVFAIISTTAEIKLRENFYYNRMLFNNADQIIFFDSPVYHRDFVVKIKNFLKEKDKISQNY